MMQQRDIQSSSGDSDKAYFVIDQDARLTDEAILSVLANFVEEKNALLSDAGNIEAALAPVRAELASQLDAIKATRALADYPTPYAGAALAAEQADTPSENRLTELTFHAVDLIVIVAHAVRTKPDAWNLQLLSLMNCILPFIRAQQQQAPLPADPQIDASQVNYAVMAASIQLELTQDSDSGAYYSLSATGHTGGANTQHFLSHSFPSDILDELEALYAKALGYWQTSNDEGNRRFAERLYQPRRKGQLNEHSLLPWVSELPTTQATSERFKPKTLLCLENIDAGLLKQFQLLSWAIDANIIHPDANVYLEDNELFVENEDNAISYDDPSGKAEAIDELDEADTDASQAVTAMKLTELIDESKFEAFFQQATEISINVETGEPQATDPDAAKLWQHIQAHAQTQAETHVLTQLGEYARLDALIEALHEGFSSYAEMLVKPSLDALMQQFYAIKQKNDEADAEVGVIAEATPQTVNEQSSAPSELFVLEMLQRLSNINASYLSSFANLVFSMIMLHSAKPAADELDVYETGAVSQTLENYIANPIDLSEALIKARCLLTMAFATRLHKNGLGVRCVSQALYYLSFVGKDKPILGKPNNDSTFQPLTQAGVDALFECLEAAVSIIPNNEFAKVIASVLKSIFTHSALRIQTESVEHSASKVIVEPTLQLLIEYFRVSTTDVANIELNSFLGSLAQSPLNQRITKPSEIAERIFAVENTLYELCARKVTFEVQQAHDTIQNLLLNELTLEQKSEQLLSSCQVDENKLTQNCLLKIRLLLRAGVDITMTTDMDGNTPLHLACLKRNRKSIAILIQSLAGAMRTQALVKPNTEGATLMHMVFGMPAGRGLRSGLQSPVKSVLELIWVLIAEKQSRVLIMKDGADNTPMHWACCTASAQTVVVMTKALIETKHNQALVAINADGYTPLALAYQANNVELTHALTQYLLEAKQFHAFVTKNTDGQTVLHRVCEQNYQDAVPTLIKLLVEAGQTRGLVIADNEGNTPLLWLCRKARTNIILTVVKALLETGQTQALLLANDEGSTPLHWACRYRSADIVEVMAKALIDVGRPELLVSTGGRGNTPLHEASSSRQRKVAQVLISALIEAQRPEALLVKNDSDDTPLAIACINRCFKNAQVLLNALIKTQQIQFLTEMSRNSYTTLYFSVLDVERFSRPIMQAYHDEAAAVLLKRLILGLDDGCRRYQEQLSRRELGSEYIALIRLQTHIFLQGLEAFCEKQTYQRDAKKLDTHKAKKHLSRFINILKHIFSDETVGVGYRSFIGNLVAGVGNAVQLNPDFSTDSVPYSSRLWVPDKYNSTERDLFIDMLEAQVASISEPTQVEITGGGDDGVVVDVSHASRLLGR